MNVALQVFERPGAPFARQHRQFDAAADLGDGEILLRIDLATICGSDLHQWTADHSWPVNYPVILGHEFAGTIEQVGNHVKGFTEGDRVVSETAAVIDPDSPMSRQGLYNLDPSRKGFGYGVNGAMTTHVRVPARCLHSLPDSMPFEPGPGLTKGGQKTFQPSGPLPERDSQPV